MMRFRNSICLIVFYLCCIYSSTEHPTSKKPQLLIVLIDGFRWDFVLRDFDNLPGFSKFYSEGSVAESVRPIFPTVSYPSWTTLMTGLYAESHGIIGNTIFDRQSGDVFSLYNYNSTLQHKWWSQEPIWTTATRQGLKVADIQLSRCEIPHDGVILENCDGWYGVGGTEPLRKHFIKAQQYFADGFDLVLVYGEFIDTMAHDYGPDSKVVYENVRQYDAIFSELFTNLSRNGLDQVNIVFVSDHGMIQVGDATKMTYVNDYLTESEINKWTVKVMVSGANFQVIAKPGQISNVYNKLKNMKGVDVYRRETFPDRFHFKNHFRIPDIFVVAKAGYYIERTRPSDGEEKPYLRGIHGYDPLLKDMRGIFFAKGPAFKKNLTIDAIGIEDIYQVYGKVLQIKANANNGTWEHIRNIFVA